MDRLIAPSRRGLLLGAAAGALLPAFSATAQSSSVLNIATTGEPGPLDPTPVTSDLLSEITQHMWETLYIFAPDFSMFPLLAAALPEISADGRQYTIALRPNATFHDGSVMTADDVIASLRRWGRLSPRGRLPMGFVTAMTAKDKLTLVLELKQPYAPFTSLLGFPNGSPIVMPKRIADLTEPLKEYVGTGPYKLIEYKPDTYVRLGRFPQYASPGGTPNGYVGKREALIDELRFIPVPNPTTRADGLLSGQFHWADNLTPESYGRLQGQATIHRGLIQPAFWPLAIMNTRKGVMSNMLVRRAVQAALNCQDAMTAAGGDPALWKLEGSIYPQGTAWYDPATPGYNQGDPKKAASLLKQAGYAGEPVRMLTSTQYDYQYKIAQVTQANMEDAGFKLDMQVTDWATILQRRQDENQWDMFITGHGTVPEPSSITVFNPTYPGWWDTPDKRAALDAFVTESDPVKRVPIWHKLQALFYSEVPTVKLGALYTTYGASTKLSGYTDADLWPAFWNAKLGAT